MSCPPSTAQKAHTPIESMVHPLLHTKAPSITTIAGAKVGNDLIERLFGMTIDVIEIAFASRWTAEKSVIGNETAIHTQTLAGIMATTSTARRNALGTTLLHQLVPIDMKAVTFSQ